MPDVFISQSKKDLPPKKAESFPDKISSTKKEKSEIAGRPHGFFSTFTLYPERIDFETRGDDEKIVLILRQHIIVNLKWIVFAILMFLTPSVVKSFGVFNSVPGGFELVTTMAWYLVSMAYAFEGFLNWYFNVYIVTNERIVDVNFHNLIYKSVSDATLDNIQDVTYNMGGVIRTVFNYGDVFIQTASEVSRFDFVAVPNPSRVSKIINELTEEHEENK